MSFELREHTADVAVEATGETLGDAFAATADGMAAAMCETVPTTGDRFRCTVTAESRDALLFDYLDELIYQRDVRGVLPVDNRATVSQSAGEWQLDGSTRGVPLASITAREVKAVTYSEMVVEEVPEGWYTYVVVDV
ncbi:archease [Halorhabdus sp. CBA1104]|uniref:archease n=1 Tax=unclassified Halorhabdus TaxID=2621901 RepID=UPI0012B2753C|nr:MULTISPECIES: archease [unclassified Halorhabdus]QGN06881.1 archease [Halorhabdus sp. CBA1104]